MINMVKRADFFAWWTF